MKRLIQIQYSIGDRVVVKDIEATGTVYAVMLSRDGIEYQVKYFVDARRATEWFVEGEIAGA